MLPVLRLVEDVFANDAVLTLPPLPRFLFTVHGSVIIAGRTLSDGETWHGEDAVTITAGRAGAACWRFELEHDPEKWIPLFGKRSCFTNDLQRDTDSTKAHPAVGIGAANVPAAGVASREKLAAPLETLPAGDLLLRGDSVAFPPGGCAYRHRHQGPGIRCLIDGGIRIDTHGRSTSYGPGGAWFESGPEPVFAQAAADRPSRFVRVMILPRALIGKSSIEYLNEEDKAKPRLQQYKIFADAPIARPA